tara:strand:+ start:310 stop:693 length:384 start_codon:yes stop_codon:yes gene_type:complete
MKYFNLLKTVWSQGFKYKGESSRKEFLEYYLLHYLIIIVLSLFKNVLNNIQYSTMEIGILSEVIAVIYQLLAIFYVFYLWGSIIVQIPFTVRCLRSAGAKWYWTFLNIINPFGCLIIYFIPLRISRK